jgi:hypothetical protein
MDEPGLNYRALPDKTLAVKGQQCTGGKGSKERLTVSLCVNQLGEFQPAVVIGKALKPRCFRNINIAGLPIKWYANKKAWMTGNIFCDWVKTFNMKMKAQGRHVILMLDNATCHTSTT